MSLFHKLIGYSVPGGFALLALWALVSFIRNKSPGGAFWNVVAVMQVVVGIQVVIGLILLIAGLQPPPSGDAPIWLHYAYGGLFPAALLVGAHRLGRKNEGIAWIIFGAVAFVNFGLTFRALQTGFGAG